MVVISIQCTSILAQISKGRPELQLVLDVLQDHLHTDVATAQFHVNNPSLTSLMSSRYSLATQPWLLEHCRFGNALNIGLQFVLFAGNILGKALFEDFNY